MKKMRVASLAISAFAISALGLASVAPAASAYNYRYNNNNWNNRYDNNRYNRHDNNNYHRDYNRYSGDNARGWFHGRYPQKRVVYVVVVYRVSNHDVYRVHCDDGSWADYDGWDGREVNRRVY